MRYIFVTGGVVSSLGKGISAASIAALLQACGYRVRVRKLDPYLNVDPGTMSPYQHGEVFVTEDGAETDMDLGHYERFTGNSALKGDSITSGKIYEKLLYKERKGAYLGNTVQVIPHITDLIKEFIFSNSDNLDFLICEIGGTVGDIEALPFLEAARQIAYDKGSANVLYIHLTLLPYINTTGELKTKPTQHSVKELRSLGIQPNILICRADREIPQSTINKIAKSCCVPENMVIAAIDQRSIYEIPLYYHEYGLDKCILEYFKLNPKHTFKLEKWEAITNSLNSPNKSIIIGVVGKYSELPEAYKSLIEALTHAGIYHMYRVKILWIDAENLSELNVKTKLSSVGGILVPGGFGARGAEGKILAIRYARENKIPLFGICLGMQLIAIEFARNVLNLHNANSTEFAPNSENPVICLMLEWQNGNKKELRGKEQDLGGTMRLGTYDCVLKQNSLAARIYEKEKICERHRHRFEFNLHYLDHFSKCGMIASGRSPDETLIEILELSTTQHPWFIGVQFHPEFKSKPLDPHPLFISFIKAAIDHGTASAL